ncbi:hypothetical protein E2562_023223 [Oryza meyeriana var. granulata]|uniref:Uncharacterized protein n=1 Tax=Oryza meyeriana var. granulata TaxID=110450 RepID=A0A6G1BZN2_9ORYZ|nr:hypothetical protein E2562_023223 [Oryza meyeriana var. granulata]
MAAFSSPVRRPAKQIPFNEPRQESYLLAGIRREQLMDFRRTTGAAQMSEASKASSSRTSDLPPFTPWFLELWVNADK